MPKLECENNFILRIQENKFSLGEGIPGPYAGRCAGCEHTPLARQVISKACSFSP